MRNLLAILVLVPIFAFGQDEYLAPSGGQFTPPFLGDYHSKLKEKLLEGAPFKPRNPVFEVYVLPSFQSEWLMTFDEPRSGECTKAWVSWVEPQYWLSWWNNTPAQTRRAEARIPTLLVCEASDVLKQVLVRTRYPAVPTHGRDGVDYFFVAFVHKHGLIEGTTWSPKEGSLTFKLVSVAERLRAMIHGSNDSAQSERQVRLALTELKAEISRLKANNTVHTDATCNRAGDRGR